jgi:hypothetical protein
LNITGVRIYTSECGDLVALVYLTDISDRLKILSNSVVPVQQISDHRLIHLNDATFNLRDLYLAIKINCLLVAWLAGCLVGGFWALWDNVKECVYCYSRCHSNAVKRFGSHEIIFMIMCVYYLDFPVTLDGQFTGMHIVDKVYSVCNVSFTRF